MRDAVVVLLALMGPAFAQPASSGRNPRAPDAALRERRAIADETPLESAVDANTYIMGPGDRLLIEAWGLTELSSEVEVNAEGSLFLPRVGVFGARGRTLRELRELIEQRLHAIYPSLHVGMTLAHPRSFLVHVVGAVASPGTSVATPLTHASALVARATPLERASTRRVEIRRQKGSATESLIADLDSFTLLGVPGADPTLLDGDTIFVPFRELEVEVTGAVRRPGRYELVNDRTVRELLRLAGGVSSEAAADRPVRVASRGGAKPPSVRELSAETVLQDGDHVHVPSIGDLGRAVFVEGAVVGAPQSDEGGRRTLLRSESLAAPGGHNRRDSDPASRDAFVSLPFVEGEGVRDLVFKVGGLQPWADARNAYLLRPAEDGTRKRIPIDITAVTAARIPDVSVAVGDTLVVPTRRDTVTVTGAVLSPGSFSFNSSLAPDDYITLAGGTNRLGVASDARILRNGASHRMKNIKSSEPGDIISVPESRLSAREWVAIAVSSVSLVVTVVSLGLTITIAQHNGTLP
jgi:protein involved in polysaccharide export with SLBB domain